MPNPPELVERCVVIDRRKLAPDPQRAVAAYGRGLRATGLGLGVRGIDDPAEMQGFDLAAERALRAVRLSAARACAALAPNMGAALGEALLPPGWNPCEDRRLAGLGTEASDAETAWNARLGWIDEAVMGALAA